MRFLCLMLIMVCCASRAFAQTSEPVGPYVIDVRGLMAGLPTQQGWLPTLPADTSVPSRGFGLEGGAHVYPVRWGKVQVGFGAALAFARGTATATLEGTPDIVTKSTTFAPQMSFNFGHRLGWSHLSAGYGAAKVVGESTAVASPPAVTAQPAATQDSGWGGAINFGGGARWFIGDHVGVGFEARWHLLGSRAATATAVAAPRTTLFHLAVGLSIH